MRTVLVFRLLPVGETLKDPAATSTAQAGPPSAQLVLPERIAVEEFQVAATRGGVSIRRESDLAQDFMSWLERQGHEVKRWQLKPESELRAMLTDVYDVTERELYEAKGTATRAAVRLAIGQLLDYRRHIKVADVKLSILLPVRPSLDLLDLIQSCGMSCVYRSTSGFERVTAMRVGSSAPTGDAAELLSLQKWRP